MDKTKRCETTRDVDAAIPRGINLFPFRSQKFCFCSRLNKECPERDPSYLCICRMYWKFWVVSGVWTPSTITLHFFGCLIGVFEEDIGLPWSGWFKNNGQCMGGPKRGHGRLRDASGWHCGQIWTKRNDVRRLGMCSGTRANILH